VAAEVHCLLEGRITLAGPPGALTTEQIEAAYFGLATSATRLPPVDQLPGAST
jgi:hypothetical protein